MQAFVQRFAALSPQRQFGAIAAALVVMAAVFGLARIAFSPGLSLLYSGLDPAAAGEVVTALDQLGAGYEVRGSAIWVDTPRRDELRMSLAAEGKPANGAAGYELLDTLTGFGTTSRMFDATYWRAKEGELARTIRSSPFVRSARVHISPVPDQPFGRGGPGSATVVVSTAEGGLNRARARMLRHLVASAVGGVQPGEVTVIDADGGLVPSENDAMAGVGGEELAEALRANVSRLLEARVGPGGAIVEVHVDREMQREQISERRIDPDGRVAISTLSEETSANSRDTRGSAVTVASNLPDGDENGTRGASDTTNANIREQVNFELSETQRDILRLPGAVRRITVAVLVDGIVTPAPDGTRSWAPRAAAEIADLRELVGSAVGYDEARGDVITIRSMEFPPRGTDREMAGFAPPLLERLQIDVMRLLQLAALLLTAVVLGLFVVRPVLASPASIGEARSLPPPGETAGPALAAPPEAAVPLVPLSAPVGGLPAEPPSRSAGDRLRDVTEGRQKEAAAVIRGWMDQTPAGS